VIVLVGLALAVLVIGAIVAVTFSKIVPPIVDRIEQRGN